MTAGNDGELKVWALDTSRLLASAQHVDLLPRRTSSFTIEGTLLQPQIRKDRAVEVVFHPSSGLLRGSRMSRRPSRLWTDTRRSRDQEGAWRRKRRRRREKVASGKGAEAERRGQRRARTRSRSMSQLPTMSDVFVSHVIVRTMGQGEVGGLGYESGEQGSPTARWDVRTTSCELYNNHAPRTKGGQDKGGRCPGLSAGPLAVELPGHRNRQYEPVSISSDDKMLASASDGSLKIWNLRTQTCIRTLEVRLRGSVAPSFPATEWSSSAPRTASFELFDVASSTLQDSVAAHDNKEIWSLQVHPDGRSDRIRRQADKKARFWELQGGPGGRLRKHEEDRRLAEARAASSSGSLR